MVIIVEICQIVLDTTKKKTKKKKNKKQNKKQKIWMLKLPKESK